MDKKIIIRTIVISLLVVVLYAELLIGVWYFFLDGHASCGIINPIIFELVVGILIFLAPPIIISVYGFLTKDTITAMIIGALLSACLSVSWFRPSLPRFFGFSLTVFYYPIISLIAGLVAYYASNKRLKPTIVASIIWFVSAWFLGVIFFSH